MSGQQLLPPEGEPDYQHPAEQDDVIDMHVHERAQELTRYHVLRFAVDLLVQAKLLAFRDGDEVVSRSHIEQALAGIKRERETSWLQNLLLALGSAFFGGEAQGFVTEISGLNRPLWNSIYVAAIFVGLIMVFLGLRRR